MVFTSPEWKWCHQDWYVCRAPTSSNVTTKCQPDKKKININMGESWPEWNSLKMSRGSRGPLRPPGGVKGQRPLSGVRGRSPLKLKHFWILKSIWDHHMKVNLNGIPMFFTVQSPVNRTAAKAPGGVQRQHPLGLGAPPSKLKRNYK